MTHPPPHPLSPRCSEACAEGAAWTSAPSLPSSFLMPQSPLRMASRGAAQLMPLPVPPHSSATWPLRSPMAQDPRSRQPMPATLGWTTPKRVAPSPKQCSQTSAMRAVQQVLWPQHVVLSRLLPSAATQAVRQWTKFALGRCGWSWQCWSSCGHLRQSSKGSRLQRSSRRWLASTDALGEWHRTAQSCPSGRSSRCRSWARLERACCSRPSSVPQFSEHLSRCLGGRSSEQFAESRSVL
mmetsp:Transcript_11675/g.45463  ORF Transcript_11675/g.45463 Transcript_11675/m.45463 type:complete len:239 (+) Transcript_11675:1161-1877(+)